MQIFWGIGCFFWVTFLSILCHFFMQNFSFLRSWKVFLCKKYRFFHTKLKFLRGWMLFLSKKNDTFLRFFRNCRTVRKASKSVPKPLKVPSLARSVLKPLKVPSLARSVPMPLSIFASQIIKRILVRKMIKSA